MSFFEALSVPYSRRVNRAELKHLSESYWRRVREGDREPREVLLEGLAEFETPPDLLRTYSLGYLLLRFYAAERGCSVAALMRLARVYSPNGLRKKLSQIERQTPSLIEAFALEHATEGRVPAEAWLIGGAGYEVMVAKALVGARRSRMTAAKKLAELGAGGPTRWELQRKLRAWVRHQLPEELRNIKPPSYGALRDWRRLNNLRTDKMESTREQPIYEEFRFRRDPITGAVEPPNGYERRLEEASAEAARVRRAALRASLERVRARRGGGGGGADQRPALEGAGQAGGIDP